MNSTHYNNVVGRALSVNFGRVFALSLSRFFSNSTGFDVAAFQHALFNGEGRLEESILRKYGKEGVDLFSKLTFREPLSDSEKEEAAKGLGRFYVAQVSEYQERQMVLV